MIWLIKKIRKQTPKPIPKPRSERPVFQEPEKTKKEFKLKVGMKFPEIYQELHNNVSGETSEEVKSFYTDDTENAVKERIFNINRMFGDNKIEYDSHEVILSNDKYAVIQKNTLIMFRQGIKKQKPEYYISGINDENQYFVHPVTDWRGDININSILDYINRVDEGFTERLQGDILLQFRPYQSENKIELGKFTNRYIRDAGIVVAFPKPANRTSPPTDELTIELGRHTLLVKNGAKRYLTDEGTYVVVESDIIEIMHPEHKKTVRYIPENHYAILANQRGRKEVERFD